MPHRWNENAILRRDQIESGLDITFSRVFVPLFRDILNRLKPKSVLEIGGGTGHMARALCDGIATYEMLEPSPGMYAVASHTLAGTHVELHSYRLEDVPKRETFDFVMSHLCVQVIDDIRTFFSALKPHLAEGAHFAISLPHPAFYNDYKEFFPKSDFRYMARAATTVSFSVTLDPSRRIEGVPYHHRPLMDYVNAVGACGMAVTEMQEVFPPRDIQALYGHEWMTPRYVILIGRTVVPRT
jgi:SAM-dependent methyltransferase